MSMMPPPMGAPILPYNICVDGVNNIFGVPISGAQFILKNLTKSTQIIKVSDEINSNIIINVADCGVWDDGDELSLDVSYGDLKNNNTMTINQILYPSGIEMGLITIGSAFFRSMPSYL